MGLPVEDDKFKVSIAKYVPHNFEWKWFNPEEEVVEKKKKNKEIKHNASEYDIRKPPFQLKDGDIIGVRLESENTIAEDGLVGDDFQTEEDNELRKMFTEQKEADRLEKQKNNPPKEGKNKKEVTLQIYADF